MCSSIPITTLEAPFKIAIEIYIVIQAQSRHSKYQMVYRVIITCRIYYKKELIFYNNIIVHSDVIPTHFTVLKSDHF